MLKYITGVFLAIFLSACTFGGQDLTVGQTSYELQDSYNALSEVAYTYARLPYCEVDPLARCSDRDIVEALKDADQAAYDALLAIRVVRGTPDEDAALAIAQVALNQLRALAVKHAIKEIVQ